MPNKYDTVADDLFGAQSSQLDASLSAAKATNPDDYAKSVQLGRETGIPSNIVQLNRPAIEGQAQTERAKKAIKYDSIAAQWLSNPDNAKLAHDDVENLSAVDTVLQGMKMAGRYTAKAGRSIMSGFPQASAGLWGVAAAPFDLVGADSIGGYLRGQQKGAERLAEDVAGLDPNAGMIERSVMSGFRSAGQNLATLPLGFAARGEQLMLGTMGLTTGGESYGRGIEQGLSPGQALAYGIEDATAEVVTERFLGASGLLRNIKAGSSAAKLFAYELAKEVPGEILATEWQNFNEWMNLNPEKSIAEFIDEQPAEIGQTIIATLVGGGTQIGAVKTLEAIGEMADRPKKAQPAIDNQTQLIEQLNKLAQASKVAQRDTQTFEDFAAQAEGATDLYIDAETFQQSGIADQVMEVSPDIRSQYADALASGGSIRIPMAEYAARIATKPELSGPLLEHLKTDPMGFSKAEAETYQKEQGPALEAEIGRVLEQAQGDDGFNASRDAVKQSVLDNLNTVARNTPAVNETYATLVAARTAVRAKQLGITPEEMFVKQQLRVQGEQVGGEVVNQRALPLAELNQFKTGKQVTFEYLRRTTGTPKYIKGTEDKYAQGTEPAGKYVIAKETSNIPDGAETGSITFSNPLVIDYGEGLYTDSTNWKHVLSKAYGGKKGKALSKAILADGYDGIITLKKDHASEIVDLSPIGKAQTLKQSAYHGSPHRFDKFDLSKIGTGEGAQSLFSEISKTDPGFTESVRDKLAADIQPLSGFDKRQSFFSALNDVIKSDRLGMRVDLSQGADSKAAPSNDIDESVVRDFKKFSDLISRKSFVEKGFGGIDAKARGSVVKAMLDVVNNLKILDSVIEFVPVDVVNVLGGSKASAKAALNDVSVLKNALSVDLDPSVSTVESASALIDSVAFLGAEKLSSAGPSDGALFTVKGGSASSAIDGWHRNPLASAAIVLSQIHSATTNGTASPVSENLQTLYQPTRAGYSPSKNIITLLKNADLSSFLHESAHYFFENDIALAKELIAKPERTAGEQQILDDVHALLKWHGLEGDLNEQLDQWNQLDFEQIRAHHERTAESWEAYLFSGKAPNIELATYFQKFREFMLNVYKSLKDFLKGHPEAGKLNDEVRGVFDRMLATDEQIALAEQARSMLPLFKTADEALQFGVDFEQYQALAKDATQAAVTALQAAGMRDMQWIHNAHGREVTKLKKQSEALRREIRQQVRTEVMSRPVYQAWSFLTNRMTAEDKLPKAKKPNTGIPEADKIEAENAEPGLGLNLEALGAGRLDAALIQNMDLPPEVVKRLEDFKMTRKTGGLHPDLVADMFGLSSGDDLARALYDVDPPNVAIEKATDARMLAENGELATPEAIDKAANKALYNLARGKMLVADANALAQATEVRKDAGTDKKGRKRTVNILPKVAQEAAASLIARLQIRNLKPAQYEAAEMKAGKLVEKAKNKGDIQTAAAQARTRLLNHYAAKAAYDAVDEVDAGRKYLKKVQEPGKIPAEHFDQIQSLLAKFDLRQATNKSLDNTAMFQTWARAQLEAGNIPPNIELLLTAQQRTQYAREVNRINEDGSPVYADEESQAVLLASMLDQSPVRNYRQLTIEEFRSLVEAVKQIEHMGKRTRKVLTDRKKREFAAVVKSISDNIIAVATKKGRVSSDVKTPTPGTLSSKHLSWRGFWGSHIKAATNVQIMDGGYGGPMWETLIQSANEAGNGEVTDSADAYKAVQSLLKPVKDQGNITDKPKFFPSIGESLNRQERIVMAMNLGNASNEQRLLGGKNWTREQIQPVLDTLTEADWKFVQGMWDMYETYRPRIAALEREINGVEPEWIEARPLTVTTQDGKTLKLRGGYAPVIFDPRASGKAASFAAEKDAKAMMQAARVASTVNKSFTKQRVNEVKGRPLFLSLDAMIGGIQDTIHYLHWQPWIIDANRLVKALDEPIRTHYGAETVSQLRAWVGDNAAGTRPARDGAERVITSLARNVSFAGLAFNLFSAVQQVTGYSQSVAVVGTKWMGKGVAKTLQNPRKAYTAATEKSAFMRKRGITRMRDLAETHTVVRDQGPIRTALDESGYAMMLAMQSAVDVPTWWAGYEKALDAGHDEADAISRADQAVIDSQGSGMAKDLAMVERSSGALRLLTGFMSFMNTTLNANYRVLKSDDSAGKKAADLVLINVIPVALTMLLKSILFPSGDDDEREPTQLAKEYAAEQISFMFGQMIGFREVSQIGAAAMGLPTYGYQGAVGMRMFADSLKLAQQVGQGDPDLPLLKTAVSTASDFLRLPGTQINRTITGTEALLSDETDNPAAIVFGYRK